MPLFKRVSVDSNVRRVQVENRQRIRSRNSQGRQEADDAKVRETLIRSQRPTRRS